ncbi:hypothetical protein NDU88_004578 [Pleurodeles waltl]|uniref:Uncharacterized protein n=1 Tax=Pleurodeles waltl TaxID=8319 RepID=A0AAV7TRN1_PLEWA|nr:hypothetical protein NDU88_004578 [Pleurodeles waltl]
MEPNAREPNLVFEVDELVSKGISYVYGKRTRLLGGRAREQHCIGVIARLAAPPTRKLITQPPLLSTAERRTSGRTKCCTPLKGEMRNLPPGCLQRERQGSSGARTEDAERSVKRRETAWRQTCERAGPSGGTGLGATSGGLKATRRICLDCYYSHPEEKRV